MKNYFFLLIFISHIANTIGSSAAPRPYEGELKKKADFDMFFESSARKSGVGCTRYYYDEKQNKEYITFISNSLNQIQFYNLSNGLLEKTVPVGSDADSYVIVNSDSIFVFFKQGTMFNICDSFGEILNVYDFSTFMKPVGTFYEMSAFYNHPQFINNKLYIRVINYENTYKESGVLVMKFAGGKLKSGNMTAPYPDWYDSESKNYNMSLPVFAVFRDSVLMSFEIEHDVFYFSENGLGEKKPARSDYLPSFSKYSSREYSSDLDYQSQCGKFTSFSYDQYHHLFYRCAQIEVPKKDRKKPEKLMKREYSISVFDESMNKLNEFKFNVKDYYAGEVIPTKNGFLLNKCNWDTKVIDGKEYLTVTYTLFEYVR